MRQKSFPSDSLNKIIALFFTMLAQHYEHHFNSNPIINRSIIRATMTEQTIFDKLIRKEIPSKIVYEDEFVFAFRDIAPVAPTHILIIPKNKDGLTGLSKAEERHEAILGKLMVAAAKIAKQEGLEKGYRIVINDGEHAGQTVFHLHVHLLGGKEFSWPPGTSL